jgi:hypothetical protein
MGAFPALPLGRRPVQSRVLVVYRLDPQVVQTYLPDGLLPRVVSGYAIAAACYTRLGGTALFRDSGTDHLAYRFAVQREDGVEAAWIPRRETSSWFEARCGAFMRGEYGKSSFEVKEDALSIELSVAEGDSEHFYLRGEAGGFPQGSVFPTAHALEHFLGDEIVRPYDPIAPEADELDLAESVAAEPLAIFEVRSPFFEQAGLEAQLDSAWRLATRRLSGAIARREAIRVLPQASASMMPVM